MIDFKEFAEEQENERLREMAFHEWALPKIKENFGVPGYDLELRKEFDRRVVFWEYKGYLIIADKSGYAPKSSKYSIFELDEEISCGFGESIEDCKNQIEQLIKEATEIK